MKDAQKVVDMLTRHREEILDAISGITQIAAEKPLTTPDGIKFLVDKGKVIGLYFNDGNQVLQICSLTNQYEVRSVLKDVDPIVWPIEENLLLTPCKYEDLEPGQFLSVFDCPELDGIRLKLPDRELQRQQVRISKGGNVQTTWSLGDDVWKVGL